MQKFNIIIYRPRAFKNLILFILGFFGFITGSYVSIRNIIKYFVGEEEP